MSKKALLIISFGSTFADTREKDIGGIENALALAFPAYDKFSAYTSGFIRKRLAAKGIIIEDAEQVLQNLAAAGYEEVLLQPTHLLHGEEFEQKVQGLEATYRNSFKKFSISQPLITQEKDYELVARAVASQFPALGKAEGIMLMGHGTPRNNNRAHGYTYKKMQEAFDALGLPVVVGTVEEEDTPNFAEALEEVLARGYKKVHLYPMMVVAGDHANNDMYGEDETSWRSRLEAKGIQTQGHLYGIGRNKAVQRLYIEHALQALEKTK